MPRIPRPTRILIGNVDITRLVTDVDFRIDYGFAHEEVQRTLRLEVLPDFEIQVHNLVDVLARIGRDRNVVERGPSADLVIVDEMATPRSGGFPHIGHGFVQNEADLPAKLCAECGMWPEHHSHGGNACHCQECMPEARDLPDDPEDLQRPGYIGEMHHPGDRRVAVPVQWEVHDEIHVWSPEQTAAFREATDRLRLDRWWRNV